MQKGEPPGSPSVSACPTVNFQPLTGTNQSRLFGGRSLRMQGMGAAWFCTGRPLQAQGATAADRNGRCACQRHKKDADAVPAPRQAARTTTTRRIPASAAFFAALTVRAVPVATTVRPSRPITS